MTEEEVLRAANTLEKAYKQGYDDGYDVGFNDAWSEVKIIMETGRRPE